MRHVTIRVLKEMVKKKMIKCNKCNQLKPESKFYKRNTKERKFSYWCKECQREYHQKHKKEINERRRERYKNMKKKREKKKNKILRLIGNKCVNCESKTNLCFHEVHGKDHPRSSSYFAKLNYIIQHYKDFAPLCRSCHNHLHILIRFCKNKENLILLIKKLGEKN